MDLNRILKKCRIPHPLIVLGCKRYYNWKRGICMDQEYQALVVFDLLTTQMNKYANKKLKPYGLKFKELNIIRFVAQTNESVYQKTICQNFQLPHSTVVGIVFRLEDKGWLLMGNSHFDKVYCHYADQKYIEELQGKDVVDDFVYDEIGEFGYTWFDANDLPPFTSYEVEGVENHHQFDLGDGYIVELIHLPGHTPGQSGYLDHQTGCFFIGDVTSAFGGEAWDVYPEFCTINA